MKRFLVCTFVFLLSTSVVHAQDNVFGKLWPFGKDKPATPKFDSINPFDSPAAPKPATRSDRLFGLPSPGALIDRAEQTTSTAFKKTRETWKGMQDFGRSLNPFAANTGPKKPRKSFIDTIFPREPREERTASTVNDFLKMKRPRF